MPGAVQGVDSQVDELHQGLPEKMVCPCQWPPVLLQVSPLCIEGTLDETSFVLGLRRKWHTLVEVLSTWLLHL